MGDSLSYLDNILEVHQFVPKLITSIVCYVKTIKF